MNHRRASATARGVGRIFRKPSTGDRLHYHSQLFFPAGSFLTSRGARSGMVTGTGHANHLNLCTFPWWRNYPPAPRANFSLLFSEAGATR